MAEEKKEKNGKKEMKSEQMYPASYLVGAVLIGLIMGTLISFAWFKTADKDALTVTGKNSVDIGTSTAEISPTDTASSSNDTASTPVPAIADNTEGLLSIDDQPAGLSVSVAHASVSSDQWLVIVEDRGGQPGNVLGAARFVGGAQSGEVQLLRATTPAKTYYGLIYKDDGDRIFSLEGDTPLRDESGNLILVSFIAR